MVIGPLDPSSPRPMAWGNVDMAPFADQKKIIDIIEGLCDKKIAGKNIASAEINGTKMVLLGKTFNQRVFEVSVRIIDELKLFPAGVHVKLNISGLSEGKPATQEIEFYQQKIE